MQITEIYQNLLQKFSPQEIVHLQETGIDPWIEVAPQAIARVANYLKHESTLAFDYLNDLCAVDYLEPDPKKKNPPDPHFEVVYHLTSFTHKHRLKLKVKLPRQQAGTEGDLPQLPSLSSVWKIADWHERETYDLMGIYFTGHPDLRRILCPEDWEGHPLRKDYQFPLEYHGIRGQ